MADSASNVIQAKETFEILQQLSELLNTGLDPETLAICIRLCENGVNPEALADVILELRKERPSPKASE